MKRISHLIVCAALVIGLAAPTALCKDKKNDKKKNEPAAPTADGMTEYKDGKRGFKLKYPADWDASTGGKDPAAEFSHKVGGEVAETIAVSLERAKDVKRTDDNLDLIMAEIQVQMRKQFGDFKVVKEEPVRVAGFDGRSLTFTGRNDKGVTVEVNLSFTVSNGRFFMLTAATTPDRYETALPTFRSVVASFEVMQQKK